MTAPAAPDLSGRTVARGAAVVAGATALSKVVGFGRDAVIAGVYGAGPELDAWFVAQGVPNLAVGLVGSASATALVPAVSRRLREGDAGGAHALAAGVLAVVSVAVAVLCAVLAAVAEPLVGTMAPGFDAATRDLAVDLTRVLLLAAVLVSAVNVLSAVLQAHRRFLAANLVGLPFNAALVVAALVLGGDHGVAALATGFVVGSVLRVLVLVPDLRRAGVRVRPGTPATWLAPEVRGVLVLALPLLAASALSNVNTIVDRIVGSGQEEGTIAALNLGYRLLTIPHALLVVAVAQAALPALSAADPRAFDRMVQRGVTRLGVVLLPIAALAIALAGPLVALVYARGSFDGADAALAQRAVAGYAVGVAALGLREYLVRCHIALDRTGVALRVVAVGMVVNVLGDVTLGRWYGVAGLAASTSVSFVVALVVAAVALVRARPGVAARPLVRPLVVAALAASLAGLVAWAAGAAVLGDRAPVEAGTAAVVAAVAVGAGAGLALYAGLVRLLAPAVWHDAVGAVAAAVRRRPRPA